MFIDHKLPYTDFHELNLDWILAKVKELSQTVADWIVVSEVKFADPIDWSISVYYPKNTIVLGYDGDTYIAKKDVPTGISLTNESYWLKIGRFNAQVSDLDTKVDTLDTKVDTLDTKVDTEVGALDGRVSATEGDIADINAETERIRTALNNAVQSLSNTQVLNGARFICVSDSYGLTPSESENWATIVKDSLGVSSSDFYTTAENGGGFIGLTGRRTYLQQLTDLYASVTNPETITHILIVGGYNDATYIRNLSGSPYEPFRNAFIAFGNYTKTHFPNARIIHFCPAWSTSDFVQHKYIRAYLNELYQAPLNIPHFSYDQNANTLLHYPGYMNDSHYHPNLTGAWLIASAVLCNLFGGNAYFGTSGGNLVPTITPSTGLTSVTLTKGFSFIDQNIVTFGFILLAVSGNLNISAGNEFRLGTLNNCLTLGGHEFQEGIVGYTKCVSSNTYRDVLLSIHDGGLYVMPLGAALVTTANTAFYGITMTGSAML